MTTEIEKNTSAKLEYVTPTEEKKIRRHFDVTTSKWYFSIVDVMGALTDTTDPRNYWKVLKSRLKKSAPELVTKCNQLKMKAKDGKYYLTDTADSETMIRIIESVPRASVEAFKLLIEDMEEVTPALVEISKRAEKENLPETHPPEMLDDAEMQLLIDGYQTDTEIFIHAFLAGVSSEELSVSVTDDKILISGSRKSPDLLIEDPRRSREEKNYLKQELIWTTFSRLIKLPCKVSKDTLDTKIENGLLTVRLEKI